LAKAARRKLTYLGPILVIIAIAAAPLLRPISRDNVSDYAFIAYVTPMALNLLGLILLLTYTATLVASELGSGTVCLMLVRPLRRGEFVVAKLFLAMTYSICLALTTGLAAWTVTAAFGDLDGVGYGGEIVVANIDMAMAYGAGMGLVLLPLFAASAYAVMVSTLTRSTGAAVASAIGIWILIDLIKHPLGVAPFVFSTHIDAPWQTFTDLCNGIQGAWSPALIWTAATSVVSFAVFTTIAVAALAKRDLQT